MNLPVVFQMNKKDKKTDQDWIGEKIGKLKITQIGYSDGGDLFFFCKCKCGQNLIVFQSEAETKQSCQKCALSQKKRFKARQVVRYITAFSNIPFGTQMIIEGQITGGKNPQYLCEYKGKLYNCFASDLEATGKKFQKNMEDELIGKSVSIRIDNHSPIKGVIIGIDYSKTQPEFEIQIANSNEIQKLIRNRFAVVEDIQIIQKKLDHQFLFQERHGE